MPNLGTVLRTEITRLSNKAARQQLTSIQRMTTAHRRQIAALRRQVTALEKEVRIQREAARPVAKKPAAEGVRFMAKGLVSLRKRLGLNAADLGRLVGVSAQSIYNWEAKKATPRKAQVASLAALRGLGKRQAQARLALL
jgi:DNA-binding transcriptional regulator YiaG